MSVFILPFLKICSFLFSRTTINIIIFKNFEKQKPKYRNEIIFQFTPLQQRQVNRIEIQNTEGVIFCNYSSGKISIHNPYRIKNFIQKHVT